MKCWPDTTGDLDRPRLISKQLLLNTMEIGVFFAFRNHCGLSTDPLKAFKGVNSLVLLTGPAQITIPPEQIPHIAHWLIPIYALELCTELGDVYN
ncbi:hypothetical protein ACTRXD_12510 [Nitrospira sp. T9]|uniref:hypothetical protein n=1 Tax=unclassified Nitrospira TaxID=2652172 RepID=UPI003F97B253